MGCLPNSCMRMCSIVYRTALLAGALCPLSTCSPALHEKHTAGGTHMVNTAPQTAADHRNQPALRPPAKSHHHCCILLVACPTHTADVTVINTAPRAAADDTSLQRQGHRALSIAMSHAVLVQR